MSISSIKSILSIKSIAAFMCLALTLSSCGGNDNDTPTPDSKSDQAVTISFQLPSGYDNATISDVSMTFSDVNTGTTTTSSPIVSESNATNITLPIGLYRVDMTGKLTYKNENNIEKEISVAAHNDNFTVTTSTTSLTMRLFATSKPEPDPADIAYNGFVLAEIFCAGSATPQGTYYYADKYFVIYNNTDHVLYADSLVIAESAFLTVSKENYTPDIMSTAFAADAIYMIPGSGKDHPVQPGGRLLIVDNAQNHKKANPNSWDETSADFEWYDESTNPQFTDIDNPDVPNLDKIYCNSLTMWSPHTQGFKSYVLARMHTDKDSYLSNYYYDYDYHLVGQTGEADMSGTSYRIPNTWIIDAVNMSVPAMFQWIVTDPSLDRGYTYCADFGWDDTRYNKSVRRKVASRDGSRAILQDTNNSSDDFEPRSTADPFHEF